MQGRERTVLELREPAAKLKREGVVRHPGALATEGATNQLAYHVVQDDRLGPVEAHVGDRGRADETTDAVGRDGAKCKGCLVEVREVVEQIPTRLAALNGGISSPAGDPLI